MPLLEIRDLHLAMKSFEGEAHVLNGINLAVERGEIWGVVGETGCGKSLTGLSVSRLVPSPPARYMQGEILFEGRDVLAASEEDMRKLRGRRIGMIFQDPTTNLNPSFRIGEQMIDVALHAAEDDPALLGLTKTASRSERRSAARRLAVELLDSVGIPNAADRLDSYPHQFSGGMRQRVLIALALIGRPDLLIADEPTTALDVSVQAQVLRILFDLVQKHRLAVMLITHNLGVVAQLCSHVAVMYAGNIVESGKVDAVLSAPKHPYTQALLAAVPGRSAVRGALSALAGSVPNLLRPPPGCRFAPRCPHAMPRCDAGAPPMIGVAAGQQVACVLYDKTAEAA
ncbi:MAG: ABC transporter ATP-binding protein [Beijerinckiaceae bacterium]